MHYREKERKNCEQLLSEPDQTADRTYWTMNQQNILFDSSKKTKYRTRFSRCKLVRFKELPGSNSQTLTLSYSSSYIYKYEIASSIFRALIFIVLTKIEVKIKERRREGRESRIRKNGGLFSHQLGCS